MGDNWFRAHEAGLLEFTRGKGADCELAYATFINSIYERPYAIFVDHKWQSVVLAIRGTLSLEDLVNDAHAEPVSVCLPCVCGLVSIMTCLLGSIPNNIVALRPLPAPQVPMDEMAKAWGFDGEGEFCHGGMLNAADCIAKDLYRHQVRQTDCARRTDGLWTVRACMHVHWLMVGFNLGPHPCNATPPHPSSCTASSSVGTGTPRPRSPPRR